MVAELGPQDRTGLVRPFLQQLGDQIGVEAPLHHRTDVLGEATRLDLLVAVEAHELDVSGLGLLAGVELEAADGVGCTRKGLLDAVAELVQLVGGVEDDLVGRLVALAEQQ